MTFINKMWIWWGFCLFFKISINGLFMLWSLNQTPILKTFFFFLNSLRIRKTWHVRNITNLWYLNEVNPDFFLTLQGKIVKNDMLQRIDCSFPLQYGWEMNLQYFFLSIMSLVSFSRHVSHKTSPTDISYIYSKKFSHYQRL